MKKNLHVVPNDDGWAARREGSQRVSKTFDTKKEATDWARDQAKKDHVELRIHNKDGQISDSDSYGRDPNPPKDRKH